MKITEITAEQSPALKKTRLAAYCRVSSDSTDQLHSFAAQIRYYSDHTKKHPEYELVDIYADRGLTGTEMKKRGELLRMIGDCKKGLIDRIVVKSVSRFARNTEELLVTLRMLTDLGVSVYFEEQGIDTDKLNMEMIVTFPGMAAQQESANISGNMRWSYQKRMQSGDFNCNCPAYGFNLVNGQMGVNESEAAVVRRIFDLYLQGVGMQAIANRLNADGIPRRYGHTRWHLGTIQYILANERYMGDALLQKKFTTETLPFRRIQNNGQFPKYHVENSNPPIVRREIYEAAQARMRSRQTGGSRRIVYPMSAKLKCPDCGRCFRRLVTAGTAYWTCSGQSSGATDCVRRRVREEAVYEAFTDMVFKLHSNRQALLGTLIRQIEAMQSRTSRSQERIHQIDREIADLGAKNQIVSKLHTDGILNAADYAKQAAEIGNSITALRIERRQKLLADEDNHLLTELRELDTLLEEFDTTTEFDNTLFVQIVQSITVNSNAQLTFRLLGGIELTENICERGRCRSA